MKNVFTVLFAAALSTTMALSIGCKKDKKETKKDEPVATKPVATTPPPAPPAKVELKAPEVAMAGSAAENMVNVFKAGVDAIKMSSPTEAAALLTLTMGKYDVADLIAKSAADKKAGKGASDELKAEFKAAKDAYKARAAELGTKDAAAFGPVAASWAKAWGLN